MSYLQSAIEYTDKWLEFYPTKSRYNIKIIENNKNKLDDDQEMDIDMEKRTILPDKDKTNFVTQINNRFMNSP